MENKILFFASLALMLQEEKDKVEITVQRTGDELTVLVVPKMKGKKAMITMSGSPEELDEAFFEELTKPVAQMKGLKSNADSAEVEDDEDGEEEEKENKSKPAAKKKSPPAPKAPVKAAPKVAEKKPVVKPAEKDIEELGEALKEENDLKKQEEETQKVLKKQAEEAEAENQKQLAAQKKKDFDAALKLGDEAAENRKFEIAEVQYKICLDLFPADQKVVAKLKSASLFVDRMIDAGILPPRKEAENGA